jgi:hypothetical protein
MNACRYYFPTAWVRSALLLAVLAGGVGPAVAAERPLEARLVWGTNHEKPDDPKVKPLEGTLAKKLRNLPLKFTNYFEVNRQAFTINDQDYKKVEMSKQCYIEVKDKGENRITVKLYGEGKLVNRVDQPLPKGETLGIAGNSRDGGAWLVIVQPVEPAAKPPPTPPKAKATAKASVAPGIAPKSK